MGSITVQLDKALRMYAQHNRPMSLAELGQRTGMSEVQLAELQDDQADDISLSALARLCDVLHCTPAELLVYTPDQPTDMPEEVESRDIVEKWERQYGDHEHPADAPTTSAAHAQQPDTQG